MGDPYTVAINPIRDTVFCGNQTAYDIWGGVSTTVSGLVIPVGQGLTAAKAAGQTGKVMLGTVGKEVAKDFARDAFVNAVSSGAGSAAMKVTGNANFSRAVSLASGVASGSKRGKVLNSLDDIGTSTVKSLNHLDNVADVSKVVDSANNAPKTIPQELTRRGQTPAIGKMKDLNTPGSVIEGEFKVADYLPDMGNPKANWKQNSGILRSVMKEEVPIKDVSMFPMDNAGFLGAERNLLQSRGWTYFDGYWYPPK